MIDWFDYRVTSTPWSLIVAGQQPVSWLEKAIARSSHMEYWWNIGGCGVCKRENVYSLRPPFCDECWRERVVELASTPSGVVPVVISSVTKSGVAFGCRYDKREIGDLPLVCKQYVQQSKSLEHDNTYLDDHDE